ncbi:YbaB/EbfC family nucleoid-associated protein [Enterococcus camelliae]|jgi:DNA-binding YbaB/EbfC family protein|uniref:Nucleoid-associated protein ACFSR0_09765 n=1 Tax=Enterococcus camelliae TaxID=453959 RepID=A0ABW5TKP1_9ENTE
MMRGMGNMQGMMKQVQKMQKEMVKAQEVLNQREFTGESTNGYVKVTVTGDRKVKQVTIDPQIIDPDDVEMVEDLVAMAVNDVIQKVEKEIESTMGKYTKGIPGF